MAQDFIPVGGAQACGGERRQPRATGGRVLGGVSAKLSGAAGRTRWRAHGCSGATATPSSPSSGCERSGRCRASVICSGTGRVHADLPVAPSSAGAVCRDREPPDRARARRGQGRGEGMVAHAAPGRDGQPQARPAAGRRVRATRARHVRGIEGGRRTARAAAAPSTEAAGGGDQRGSAGGCGGRAAQGTGCG